MHFFEEINKSEQLALFSHSVHGVVHLFAIYYYDGTPLLMCNLLFYSITTLSNSISSSQNVFKFISETAEPDYLIFKETIDHVDLMNKIDILKLFINDVIKLFCKTEEKEKEKENLQILFNEELIYNYYNQWINKLKELKEK